MTNPTILERRALLSCLAANQTPQQIHSDIINPQLSWEKTLGAACQLGIGPLLYARLGELGVRDKIPVDVLRQSKAHCFSSQARNMKVYAELKTVLEALTGEGLPVIVLKGAVLAELVYQHVGLRTMADVDLLVDKKNLDKAGSILERLGYVPDEHHRDKHWYREHHHHLVPYVSSDGSMTIEIHWHIIERTAFNDLPIEELWAHARAVKIASVPCLTLSAEHMLLHVGLHLSSPNRFQGQLRGLYDVAELLRRYGDDLDWTEVCRVATIADARKYLYVVLCLARDALGAPVPIVAIRQLRREISFLPFEERLVMQLALNAAFIIDVEEDSIYEWVLLDLLNGLLGCRTRREACQTVITKIAQRARLTMASKWGRQVVSSSRRV
ncbi:MAG: hypothetical protein E8D41_11345 [Nitrospira sp.]|nr:MAG: hypothetical protein E8D41_11345 [Nitrospira sp.]